MLLGIIRKFFNLIISLVKSIFIRKIFSIKIIIKKVKIIKYIECIILN
jgi:hypothetical protein